MAKLNYKPIPHDHQAFLAKARAREGFTQAYEALALEYQVDRDVQTAMREALQRFATGTYAVWYPLLQRREAESLPQELRRLAPGDWLLISLTLTASAADGFGMHGSGMFVFNPPWNLEEALREAMPALVDALRLDGAASFELRFQQT